MKGIVTTITGKFSNSPAIQKRVGVFYLLILFWLLFLAPFRQGTITGYNLIPLNSYAEFAEMFRPKSMLYWIVNVPGNVAAFYPIPFILFGAFSFTASVLLAILLALIIPVSIEMLQWYFAVGYANVDDVLLNFTGFLLGYWHWERRRTVRLG